MGSSRQGAWFPLHRLWPSRQEQLQGGRVLYQEHIGGEEKSVCEQCMRRSSEMKDYMFIHYPYKKKQSSPNTAEKYTHLYIDLKEENIPDIPSAAHFR